MNKLAISLLSLLLLSCSSGDQKSDEGTGVGAADCSGQCANASTFLSIADVQRVIAQAVNEASARGARATIAVTDRVGNVLGVFRMTGADTSITIPAPRGVEGGLNGLTIIPDTMAAIGVSGDGVDQDDLVAFLGLHEAGQLLGTINNAPRAMRADQLKPQGTRLRYVQCPQSPYINSSAAQVCDGK